MKVSSEFVTTTLAAKMMGVSRQAVTKMIQKNKIETIKVETGNGHFIHIIKSVDIEKIVSER